MKTNLKCKCGGKIEPTEDFFIWKCSACKLNIVMQCAFFTDEELNQPKTEQ